MQFTELKQLHQLIKTEVSSCLIVSDGFKFHSIKLPMVKVKVAQKIAITFVVRVATRLPFFKNYVGLKFKRLYMINRIT